MKSDFFPISTAGTSWEMNPLPKECLEHCWVYEKSSFEVDFNKDKKNTRSPLQQTK